MLNRRRSIAGRLTQLEERLRHVRPSAPMRHYLDHHPEVPSLIERLQRRADALGVMFSMPHAFNNTTRAGLATLARDSEGFAALDRLAELSAAAIPDAIEDDTTV